jgi:putative cell wall-binding protein
VNYIQQNNIRKATLIGGTQVISETVKEQLLQLGVSNIERISGDTRFSTSIEIAKRFADYFDISTVSIASGRSFIDALPGSSYSSLQRAPIILTDTNSLPPEVQAWMEKEGINTTTFTVLGGYSAITEKVRKAVEEYCF